mgnify:CR=1 FL=1
MNNQLVNFLSGQSVIKIHNADDMKCFVNWLKKYDIYDILVCNKKYADEYAKISFWKDIAKQIMSKKNEWIHPSCLSIYFTFRSHIEWFYKQKEIIDEYGTESVVVLGSQLK